MDDSPFIRMTLKKILSMDSDIEVLDTARDGKEGIYKIQLLKPDVVTMDVEMPVMNGLQALEEIMRWQPVPVIILSSVTTEGAKLTMKALELGAVEVVAKPSGNHGDDLFTLSQDIVLKVKIAACVDPARLRKRSMENSGFIAKLSKSTEKIKSSYILGNTDDGEQAKKRNNPKMIRKLPNKPVEIVAIGTSTGGPSALQSVLQKLPAEFSVPVIVAQHMPAGFTVTLANRLNGICKINVKEVENGEVLKAGTVYIGEAGKQFQVKRKNNQLVAVVTSESPIATLYKPSVDVMFMSLASEVGGGVVGVVMTGMGNDGLKGMKELKAQGAFAVAESEKTCIVYGMPRVIVEAGYADRIELLSDIGECIIQVVARR
ncbi:MAG: chemotaxis-specific protein-glutamate methyltransferase CheB [Eubacteriales bacterium]